LIGGGGGLAQPNKVKVGSNIAVNSNWIFMGFVPFLKLSWLNRANMETRNGFWRKNPLGFSTAAHNKNLAKILAN
jgi:hypothetical protein